MMGGFFREHTGKLCSRRVLGSLGFLCCIAAVFGGVRHELLEPLLWASAGLIGSTTLDLRAGRAAGKKEEGEDV